ncbi:MAG: methyltransferase domain-containing protein [Zavarzinella sp.]
MQARKPMSVGNTDYVWQRVVPRSDRGNAPEPDIALLERLARRELWRDERSLKPLPVCAEIGSDDWFEAIATRRFERHGRWIPHLFKFDRYRDETILAFGDTLGLEWAEFAKKHAKLIVVDPSTTYLDTIQAHFHARNLSATYHHSFYNRVPIADESVDVVAVFFNHMNLENLCSIIETAQRVLRPGGRFMGVVPASRNMSDVKRWLRPWAPPGELPGSMIAKQIKEQLTGFNAAKIRKRGLKRSQVPYLLRIYSLGLLERLFGYYHFIRAYKPFQPPQAIRLAA